MTFTNSDLLCGNIASNSWNGICNCGENSFEMNWNNDFVCISDTNCKLEPQGKFTTQRYLRLILSKYPNKK